MRSCPPLDWLIADEPQVRFMHQGGGLQGVPAPFLRHAPARNVPELIVHGLEKFLGRRRFASRGVAQQPRHVSRRIPLDSIGPTGHAYHYSTANRAAEECHQTGIQPYCTTTWSAPEIVGACGTQTVSR